MPLSPDQVVHERNCKRFLLRLEDDTSCTDDEKVSYARLDYEIIKDDLLDLYYTEVPAKSRGKGIGAILAEGAFKILLRDFSEGTKFKLSCSYLRKFMKNTLAFSESEKRRFIMDDCS